MILAPEPALLDAIYDAVVNPAAWELVCDRISALAGATGTLLVPGRTEARAYGLRYSQSITGLIDDYVRDGWYLRDERNPAIGMFAQKPIVLDQDITTLDRIAASAYHHEFIKASGLKWFAGIGFNVRGEWWAAAIQRNDKQGPFQERDRERLEFVSGHLSRATTMAAALGYARAEGALEAFERMSVGALAIDGGGRVILANPAALALMGDGLQITLNQLRAADSEASAKLGALIQGSVRGPHVMVDSRQRMIMVVRPSGKRDYQIAACPLSVRGADVFSQARALLLIVDPEQRRKPGSELLRAQFSMTKSEAKLAALLAAGCSLADAADALAITEETARSYLKSIFTKTETHSQGQLVSLLASLSVLANDREVS